MRWIILSGLLYIVSTVAVAQFCAVPHATLATIPFDSMTLYVQRTGTVEGDDHLETLIKKYWTLTPHIRMVSHSEMQALRNDEDALFLEHMKQDLVSVEVRHGRAKPGESSTTSVLKESNLQQGELLHVLAPPFFAMPRPNRTFRSYSGYKSYLTLRRGAPSRAARILPRFDGQSEIQFEDTLYRDLIAYAPIAVQSWEAKGASHTFRQAMLLKGLIDAIELVRDHELNGQRSKLEQRQCEAYTKRLNASKGRTILIPKELFDEKLHGTLKEAFKERYTPVDVNELDLQYQAAQVDGLVVLPIDAQLCVVDLLDDKVVYMEKVKGRSGKLDRSAIRRCALAISMASRK